MVKFEEGVFYEKHVDVVVREKVNEFLFLIIDIIRVQKTEHEVWGEEKIGENILVEEFHYDLSYKEDSAYWVWDS